MKKSHYERLMNTPVKEMIEDMSRHLNVIGKGLYHIDFIQNFAKDFYPASWNHGSAGGTMLRALIFQAMFGKKIYALASDFSEQLRKVKVTVKAICIPESEEVICIELPNWTGYEAVYIGVVRGLGPDSVGEVYCRLEMQFSRLDRDRDSYYRAMFHFYNEDETMEDSISRFGESIDLSHDLIRYVLNAYLYIHSGSPDLRQFSPPKKPLSKKPKVIRRYERECEQTSMYPVILVGFNFKKTFEVSGHFQGYWTGTGRSNFELKWKDPYLKGDVVKNL